MPESRGDEAVTFDALATTSAAACFARVPFEIAERVRDSLVVSCADGRRDILVADPEEDADALGSSEGQIERADLTILRRASQLRPARRVLPLEERSEVLGFDESIDIKGGGACSGPRPWSLAAAGVVVLPPGRDGLRVIALRAPASAELANRQHIAYVAREAAHPRQSATLYLGWAA